MRRRPRGGGAGRRQAQRGRRHLPDAFARLAYPPNALGHYCRPTTAPCWSTPPPASPTGAWRRLARGFDGAWPYLELIAGANRRSDPLDAQVVEAYRSGNRLLEQVEMASLGNALLERFRTRTGRAFARLAETVRPALRPPHRQAVWRSSAGCRTRTRPRRWGSEPTSRPGGWPGQAGPSGT